jgi:ABC-type transporter Mla subunit MlaD
MSLPDRELTPTELRQLCESNSRAIMALADRTAETNRNLDRLEQAISETNRNIGRLEHNTTAASDAVFQLAELMGRFFQSQINTNSTLEERINRIDPQN